MSRRGIFIFVPDFPFKSKLHPNELLVITIPGCPYCFESIATLKKLKQRNPKLKVTFLVCSKDKNTLQPYAKEIDHSFEITTTNDAQKWEKLVRGKFPSYVRLKNGKLQIWSNDTFGCLAKDEVEKEVIINHKYSQKLSLCIPIVFVG